MIAAYSPRSTDRNRKCRMKVWGGYRTEHSTNVGMIGWFQDATTAERAHALINELTTALQVEGEAGRLTAGEPNDRHSDEVMKLLSDLNVHSIRPRELEQFLYDAGLGRVQRTAGQPPG
uniref:Uncharacterized protein n=1 Tax=Streptomyces sp. NRRL 30471 TaxID=996287 RepID=F2WUE9_9ACTN|nr:hypothetical protein [Streptomyces sp. NRRL 30471]